MLIDILNSNITNGKCQHIGRGYWLNRDGPSVSALVGDKCYKVLVDESVLHSVSINKIKDDRDQSMRIDIRHIKQRLHPV